MRTRFLRPIDRPVQLSWLIALALALTLIWVAAASAIAGAEPAAGQATDWRQHWSFTPPPSLPGVPDPKTAKAKHPIDVFIRDRLRAARLKPSPPADRRTLIRRLSLDLLGLPPSPENVRAFVNDTRPGAYERLVDQLLASPHFGEHWARHWLDLARYADSDGYEKDGARPYAYLYRDWVIDAINRDMPFDEFTIEQLAGDLLPGATISQRIATGFHRQSLINKEGGVDQEEYRCRATVDRTHTTAAAWLGLTMGCAECHNHKYDPISQREFYQFYAFFNRASDAELSLPTDKERAAHARALDEWKAKLAKLDEQIAQQKQQKPESPEGAPSPANPAAGDKTKIDDELKRLRDERSKLRQAEPKLKGTAAMILEPAERTTHIHVRGDFLQKGESVETGTPGFLPPLEARGSKADRLDLARWIVSPNNPLTARVTVNHIWRQLFGRGLVATENDFGLRGEPPSHPELLDWLAREFIRLGWSRKALIRRIVTSQTYQQASSGRADLTERDPLNILLARQGRFRIEAEVVRDTALAVSGLLNRRVGGPSFKPPLPQDLANINYANGLRWDVAKPDEQHRRGLYIHFQRTVPYPMLMAFDAPESTVTCTRRERSNSPLQALTLLNNETFLQCARALARRLQLDPEHPQGSIRTAFEMVTSRPPAAAEVHTLRAFWNHQSRLFATDPSAARAVLALDSTNTSTDPMLVPQATAVALARVLLNLEETMTRE